MPSSLAVQRLRMNQVLQKTGTTKELADVTEVLLEMEKTVSKLRADLITLHLKTQRRCAWCDDDGDRGQN